MGEALHPKPTPQKLLVCGPLAVAQLDFHAWTCVENDGCWFPFWSATKKFLAQSDAANVLPGYSTQCGCRHRNLQASQLRFFFGSRKTWTLVVIVCAVMVVWSLSHFHTQAPTLHEAYCTFHESILKWTKEISPLEGVEVGGVVHPPTLDGHSWGGRWCTPPPWMGTAGGGRWCTPPMEWEQLGGEGGGASPMV